MGPPRSGSPIRGSTGLRVRRRTARWADRPDRPVAVRLDHGGVETRLASQIWRVRLVDHPTASDLELVHEFPFDPNAATAPQATGLAFAKSGNLYVSLIGPNQIAVLDPAGDQIGRISDPRFHSPWGLAFSGKSLLVTNGDLEPGDQPRRLEDLQGTSARPGCRSTDRRRRSACRMAARPVFSTGRAVV